MINPSFTINYKNCGIMLISKGLCRTDVLLHCFSSTSYSSVFFTWSVVLCIRIPARSRPYSRSKYYSFWNGGLRELIQLVIPGECLTGNDGIAYERSFA